MMATQVYSVWAIPPLDVAATLGNLMAGLRLEFGGLHFEPHITVVGAIRLTEAQNKLRSAWEGFKAYNGTVDRCTSLQVA
ncbi:hypothetical protein AHAS_Ahas14G0109000 [Arachis hypogaea]